MSIAGGVYAVIDPQAINVLAATLTIYLVLTSWHAGKTKVLSRGRVEVAGLVAIFLVTSITLGLAGYILLTPAESVHGYGADAYLTIGLMALVALIADISLLIRGRVEGRSRIVRHLWRMCLSYFIAAGSLFEGPGVKIFSEAIQQSGLLALPVPLVMLYTLFWLIKMHLPKQKWRVTKS